MNTITSARKVTRIPAFPVSATKPRTPGLTAEEKGYLAQYEGRLTMVRDRTRGVAEGFQTGFYLHGEGGVGKSHTVLQELQRIGATFRLVNSRITAKGLFEEIEDHPTDVIVLEDVERLCRDDNAAGVLRSALWANNATSHAMRRERLVTWRTAEGSRRVTFTGGIIFTMNSPIDDLPALRALKTRIAHVSLDPTREEIAALMKTVALQGYRRDPRELSHVECIEVYDFLILKCNETARKLDLRVLVNCFDDRLQYDAGHSDTPWQDLVDSRISERVNVPVTRKTQMDSDRQIALEIQAMKLGNVKTLMTWKQRTGKGKQAYYDRLAGK